MYSSRDDSNIILFKSLYSLTIFAWLKFFPFSRNLDPFQDKWLMSCFVDIGNDLRKRKWNGQIFIEMRSHSTEFEVSWMRTIQEKWVRMLAYIYTNKIVRYVTSSL